MATAAVSIDNMETVFAALRHALHSRDAGTMIAAAKAARAVLEQVSEGNIRDIDPQSQARLRTLSAEVETMRVGVSMASDDVRQRIAGLAQAGVENAVPGYRP